MHQQQLHLKTVNSVKTENLHLEFEEIWPCTGGSTSELLLWYQFPLQTNRSHCAAGFHHGSVNY